VFPTAERLVYSPINYRLVLVVDALGASVFLLLGLWAPASWAARVAAAAAGFTAWGFLEYAIHRWVGHGPPSIARRGHAEHHSDDTALIAAPVFVVLIGAFAVWALLSLVVTIAVASLLVFGLYLGYNHYALLHHVLHHHETFTGRVGLQHLERIHHIHHAQQSVNFGVTSTLWDRVLGTYQPPAAASRRAGGEACQRRPGSPNLKELVKKYDVERRTRRTRRKNVSIFSLRVPRFLRCT
jgi:sterol desaturase/sphingolipid hydroxylase (fatty acid hydroxylase superfamily)